MRTPTRVWRFTQYWMGLGLLALFYWVPGELLAGNQNLDKALGALTIWAGLVWLFSVGWFAGKGQWKMIGLLFWAFVAVAPMAHWGWTATAFDRQIGMGSQYGLAMIDWEVYRDVSPQSE